jgi:hypothetical protein
VATQAEVDLVINASNALPQVTRDLNRIVTTAENGAPDIDLDAALNTRQSLASVRADLARVIATADASADDIDLTAVLNQANTLRDLDAQLSSVISRAQAGAAQDPIQIQGVLDGARTLVQVRGELDRVITTAQRTAPPVVVRGEIDWDRDQLRGVGNSLADVDFRLGRIVSTGGRASSAWGRRRPLLPLSWPASWARSRTSSRPPPWRPRASWPSSSPRTPCAWA